MENPVLWDRGIMISPMRSERDIGAVRIFRRAAVVPPFFHQVKRPDQKPEQNRQPDGGDQTSGKEPPGVAKIQTGDHERTDIHADQQYDADQRSDLLGGYFFMLLICGVFARFHMVFLIFRTTFVSALSKQRMGGANRHLAFGYNLTYFTMKEKRLMKRKFVGSKEMFSITTIWYGDKITNWIFYICQIAIQ